MRAVLTASAVAALALSACAPVDPAAPGPGPGMTAAESHRQCFVISQVRNFRQGRPDQVFLRVSRDEVFELNAGGGCADLDFAIRLALIPDMGETVGSRLCTDDWARIIVPGSTLPNSVCRVRVIRKLTAEQVAALPAAHRP
ncbi:DUF6491 family protein [Brevundimonas sp.]|uniref:DUF6491 family protein n=1 Tax=Brevundimonas sp. TaxID=1871086 RepID=UPI002CC9150B|nr:DUF6491 family protein [Brevundimonas sp.]HWQ86799.1 DUF6491 family protein [Brevundimonas sp.]